MNLSTRITGSLLALLLVLGLAPNPAIGASDENPAWALDSYSKKGPGPIGTVESLGRFWVNGRLSHSRAPIWGGELLQSAAQIGAGVSLSRLGQVRLGSATATRISATWTSERACVVISLLSGELSIKLRENVGAYVQAGNLAFTTSNGARFKAVIKNGRPDIELLAGEIWFEQQPAQRRYVVRPVGIGSNISVKARSTRQIQVQVTDENDRPAPDLPIIFALGGAGIGSLGTGAAAGASITVSTDSQGLARVQFTAGDNPGSDSISATVEGTRFSWIGQLSVARAGTGFWSARNTLLVVGAAAGAAVIGVLASRDDSQPITPVIPPRVEP
jgi:hypothetical protein